MAINKKGQILTSARQEGLVGCYQCGTVHRSSKIRCRTCGARLESRQKNSLQTVWAWLTTGLIFYVPANQYPLLSNRILGNNNEHTIIEGIIVFFHRDDYFVAIVVLTASIIIPVLKFIFIGFLALNIQYAWSKNARTLFFINELVEIIGRWSMIDVFVVALLTALIQLGAVVSILPGPGSICFGLSVIFTMFAAQSIDTKRLWDNHTLEASHD